MTGNIYQGKVAIIALAEVQHCERAFTTAHGGRNEKNEAQPNGLQVITSKTNYDFDRDMWSNPAYVPQDEADQFLKEWSAYRERVETSSPHPGLRTDVPPPSQDLQKKVRCMICGPDESSKLWVEHGGRKIKIEGSKDLAGKMVEFREIAIKHFNWLALGEYKVVPFGEAS